MKPILAALDTALLPPATLAELYRFAWLLTGDAPMAEHSLGAALGEVDCHLEGLRNAAGRHAWLLRKIRQTCLKSSPAETASAGAAPRLLREEMLQGVEILEIEAYIVAKRFHTLPEPDRSALALFYLDLLSPAESAKLLELTLEAYCGVLGRARVRLHQSLRDFQSAATPTA